MILSVDGEVATTMNIDDLLQGSDDTQVALGMRYFGGAQTHLPDLLKYLLSTYTHNCIC